MARKPTTFSKVSTGYNDSANTVGESGYDLGFIDGYAEGSLTLAGNLSATGNVTATGGLITGGGTEIIAISTATAELDFGSTTSLANASLKTMALSGATNGDTLIVNVDSEWSGYDPLVLTVTSGNTTGEVNVICNNVSGITAFDPAAVVVRVTRINWSEYV